MTNEISRRGFLAATAGVTALAMSAKSYSKIIGANDRIGVGLIGAGGQGNTHWDSLKNLATSNNLNLIAVADCWTKRAQESAAKVGAPHHFQDYRKVLDIKEIDYVTIATPEHRHAPYGARSAGCRHFELGGNSLIGIDLIARLRKELGVPTMPAHVLYEAPTINAMAALFDQNMPRAARVEERLDRGARRRERQAQRRSTA